MKSRHLAQGSLVLVLGGCSPSFDQGGRETEPAAAPVPEAVIQLAAPYQDLTTARLQAEDGCYWYLHSGPVETTLLPLRTVEGRPICTASSPAVSG
ncbi:hypothetical protein [Gymnodinialimonas phycosphaerae]|uniref:hypothetical protein n=1 Tax=Gymnodinialimonas phycosphaerae TaxID=2841589 RepID=UPI003D03F3A7